ncbi:hypothetical protein IL306_010604 [Fusarium sp. DS 682]|nr:hypothetical protein IL306_010604 [Fusarium sp. DS 682]
MAGLALGGGSSSQVQDVRIKVSARMDNKGLVVFKSKVNGKDKEIKSPRTRWVQVEGGFVFESNDYGCTFFTKEIKAAKK